MLIPLGILAASGASAGSFDLLETQVLGSTTATVTFSNLNSAYGSSYQHLQIRYVGRSTRSAQDSNLRLRFNNDSGTYSFHNLDGYGSGSPISGFGSSNGMLVATEIGNTNVSGSFAVGTIDILDAFESTKNKVTRSLSGYVGGNSAIALKSGLWVNTAAITQIDLTNWDGASHAAGSRFSLYGIRA